MDQAAAGKVLVVDDEPDAVEFVTVALEEVGYEVISAADGIEGLRVALEEKPDLVILDVQMPGKDGFAVYDEMRRSPELADTPVVMLTGVGERTGIRFSAEAMKEYFGREPDAYIEKPIDPRQLQETVQGLLPG
jgi:CheY-like chemotaxis protein